MSEGGSNGREGAREVGSKDSSVGEYGEHGWTGQES